MDILFKWILFYLAFYFSFLFNDYYQLYIISIIGIGITQIIHNKPTIADYIINTLGVFIFYNMN